MNNRIYTGFVVGLIKKTVKVKVWQWRKLRNYPKQIRSVKTIQAHNEDYQINLGDKVIIEGCRPRSKTKKFEVKKIENK